MCHCSPDYSLKFTPLSPTAIAISQPFRNKTTLIKPIQTGLFSASWDRGEGGIGGPTSVTLQPLMV